ncbi:hypothetical protein ACFLQJ_00120 [Calditrichota bacterium]
MTRKVLIMLLVMLIPIAFSIAQTMDVHHGERNPFQISLMEMDSMTFESETTGIPQGINLQLGNTAIDAGGSLWKLQLTAMVTDEEGDPVENGWTVQFFVSPEIASVGTAVTGNENFGGRSTPGVAYGTLLYSGEHSLDTVAVTAFVRQYEAVNAEREFGLPLNDPEFSIFVDRANWSFIDEDTAPIHVSVLLVDGLGTEVNDVIIRFSGSRGQYFEDQDGEVARNEAATGPYDYPDGVDSDGNGWAQRWLRAEFDDVFPDPRVLEATFSVWATVVGQGNIGSDTLVVSVAH